MFWPGVQEHEALIWAVLAAPVLLLLLPLLSLLGGSKVRAAMCLCVCSWDPISVRHNAAWRSFLPQVPLSKNSKQHVSSNSLAE